MAKAKERVRRQLIKLSYVKNQSCEICKTSFSQFKTFFKHFTCDFCDKTYTIKKSLKRHILRHYGIKFQCDYCQIYCAQKHALKTHIEEFHLNIKMYYCTYCSRNYRSRRLLNEHIGKHGVIIVKSGDIKNSLDKFICQQCTKHFCSTSRLKDHISVTHDKGNMGVKCDICNKYYKCERYLKDHIRLNHSSRKQFKCLKCSKDYTVKRNLDKHLKSCRGMSKVSKRKKKPMKPPKEMQLLSAHSSICTDEKLKCDSCFIRFDNREELKDHFAKTHFDNNNTAEKDLKIICEIQHLKQEPDFDTHFSTSCWIDMYDETVIKSEESEDDIRH